MPCFRPLRAFRSWQGRVSFGKELADSVPLPLPCGVCHGCLMDKARAWSLRCQHEAACWDHNVFVNLTYDDEHLPWHRGLEPVALQKFLKRLRRCVAGVSPPPGGGRPPVRFFGVGEYGERSQRPHYHVLLFNVRLEASRRIGKEEFESDLISQLWPFGRHTCGTVTPRSCAYVAGYALKKVGRRGVLVEVLDPETGEVVERVREFARMSLRPAIGQFWFDRFKCDIEKGYVVREGSKVKVPRFYMDKLRKCDPLSAESVEWARAQLSARVSSEDKTDERLAVAERVAVAGHALFRSEERL